MTLGVTMVVKSTIDGDIQIMSEFAGNIAQVNIPLEHLDDVLALIKQERLKSKNERVLQ